MKRITLVIITILISFLNINAQKKVVSTAERALNKGNIKVAWDTLKYALEHGETKNLPGTWFLRGQILQAMARSTDENIKNLVENPTKEAYSSYQKAIELDDKKRINRKIDLVLNDLYIIAVTNGGEAYEKKDFDRALDLFELALVIETNPIFKNIVDTAMIFNCGLAAMNAKKYDKAAEYFKKAIHYKYNAGITYSLLRATLMEKGDTAAAVAVMKEGFENYPNDLNLIVDLVNYYLVANQIKEALEYLNMAKAKEPNNHSFYFAEGTLYEKLNDIENAEKAYFKVIELDPKNFNAYYNLGVLYYNRASKIFDAASNEKDDAKYLKLDQEGKELLKKSIPYFEQAHMIDPRDEVTAKTLRGLYFRFDMKDKYNEINAKMGW